MITSAPIQMEKLQRKLQPEEHAPSAMGRPGTKGGQENVKETGAIVSFTGYVRGSGIRAMSLEHYPGMTELSIQACVQRARGRWELNGVVVAHRIGELLPGELIVWVGVAASHRANAFSACESIMDFLKVEVPLWKREQALDGSWHWVEANQRIRHVPRGGRMSLVTPPQATQTGKYRDADISEPRSAELPIDAREFRNALGLFTTGVCLVTLRDDEGVAHALTVNSFASVSLDPPLVLWSLQKDSEVYGLFARAQRFAIGLLSATQESHSTTYAQKGMHHMDIAHYAIGENGAPIVHGALANFECSLERAIDGGDHTILLGRVTRIRPGDSAGPLVFQGGAYRLLR